MDFEAYGSEVRNPHLRYRPIIFLYAYRNSGRQSRIASLQTYIRTLEPRNTSQGYQQLLRHDVTVLKKLSMDT